MPTKRVIVVVSGETERRALPHLLSHLQGCELDLRTTVHGRVTPTTAALVARAAYWERRTGGWRADKIVVLADADAQAVSEAEHRLSPVGSRLADLGLPVLVAIAKWHLEAWFFADRSGLERFLTRSIGRVGQPDSIGRPKERLRNLLPARVYTARTAERIASGLDAAVIRSASPSFARFETAVLNGADAPAHRSRR